MWKTPKSEKTHGLSKKKIYYILNLYNRISFFLKPHNLKYIFSPDYPNKYSCINIFTSTILSIGIKQN